MPFEVFNVSEYIRKTCEENPEFRDLYIKMQPDEKIMRTFAGFRKDLTFKHKVKLLGFKKKKLQRIVADDIDSAKLKDLKKLADGMGKTLRIEFVPKEQAVREFMDELTEEGGESMDEMENTEMEMIKVCVEEFSRLQGWMEMAEKDSELYRSLKTRYRDLKVILTAMGVNVTELDTIRE